MSLAELEAAAGRAAEGANVRLRAERKAFALVITIGARVLDFSRIEPGSRRERAHDELAEVLAEFCREAAEIAEIFERAGALVWLNAEGGQS